MKLTKLNDPMIDLLGRPMLMGNEPLTLKRALVSIISNGTSADPLATMQIAHKLMHEKNGSCTLTNKEGDIAKKQTVADRSYTDLVKAQVIAALKDKKDA